MNRRKFTIALGTATAGLVAGSALLGQDKEEKPKKTKKAKHDCAGKNSCKGKGGCHVPLETAKTDKKKKS